MRSSRRASKKVPFPYIWVLATYAFQYVTVPHPPVHVCWLTPANPNADITICTGSYTAGSLAAVRAFSHEDVAQSNIDAVRERIGRVTNFYALFRVPVVNGRIPPPRLASSLIECRPLG